MRCPKLAQAAQVYLEFCIVLRSHPFSDCTYDLLGKQRPNLRMPLPGRAGARFLWAQRSGGATRSVGLSEPGLRARQGKTPRSLMQGLPRDWRHSWVVNKKTGMPSEYPAAKIHPAIEERPGILELEADLEAWLLEPR